MRFRAAVSFSCPTCDAPVAIRGAGIAEDGNIYLTAPCEQCRAMVVLNIERVITALVSKEAEYEKGN